MNLDCLCSQQGPLLVQYWAHGDPPPLLAARMSQWHVCNPAWTYLCFDRLSAADVLRAAWGVDLALAFLDIRLPAMQADVFRVAVTLLCGGLWVDAATTCLGPLSVWLDSQASLVLLRKPTMESPLVWNGFIYAAQSQHPFLQAAWHQIATVIRQRKGTGIWKLVGPGLYRDLLCDPCYNEGVLVLDSSVYGVGLSIGSSAEVLPIEQHWSKRQRQESLYFSQPFRLPSA